jgi:signal transduction histidine kinase/ActR/RegA family two-component response regulator
MRNPGREKRLCSTQGALPDFRALFESAPGLYLVLTPEFRIVAVSDAYLRATMTTRDSILGRDIFDVFPDNPDDPLATGVQNLRASLKRVLQNRFSDTMPIQKYDIRRPEAQGGGFEVRYWSPLNAPVIGPGGEVVFIIYRVEDVTDFVTSKDAGCQREQRAHELEVRAEQMEAEIYVRAQEVAEANRQLRSANNELNRLYRQIAVLMAQADQKLRLPGGPEEQPDHSAQSIAPEQMLARIGQLITQHLQMGEQLRQAQKMEAVGRLAGGIAHDFNNLLTVITGFASFLSGKYPPDAVPPELREIERAAARAAELTGKLLAFSRKQVLRPRIIDLNSVVSGMEGFLRRLIGENIKLVRVLGTGLGRVKADPTQIEQVIMNLAVNARDAMPDGGRLVIETKNIELAAGQTGSLPAGSYVMMSVSDTGHGMDRETAKRVFEPFFTTKEVGQGTGLGLATAYGIAEQSGGTLTVQSGPGQGAIFRMYLPRTEEMAEPGITEPVRMMRKDEAGSILVVEDETPLRQLLSRILTTAGYAVIEAASGEEALIKSQQSPASIDLVLTDVVMAGMNGPDLVARLHKAQPEMAVLYMSGYNRELIDPKALERTASFLPKPFTPEALLSRVAESLHYQSGRRSVDASLREQRFRRF